MTQEEVDATLNDHDDRLAKLEAANASADSRLAKVEGLVLYEPGQNFSELPETHLLRKMDQLIDARAATTVSSGTFRLVKGIVTAVPRALGALLGLGKKG